MKLLFPIVALAGLLFSQTLLAIPIRILAWDQVMSGRELALVHDKKAVPGPPSWDAVRVEPRGGARNPDVQVFSYDKPDRPIFSSVWDYNPDERTLVFLIPGEDPRIGPAVP